MNRIRFQFFDLSVDLASTDDEFLDRFLRLYHHFQVEDFPSSATSQLAIVYTKPAHGAAAGTLTLDGMDWPLGPAMRYEGPVYEFLLKQIYERVRSHLLIHASGVNLGGQGVLFIGNSGFGKSTLALSLVSRGAQFLSDEVGALNRVDATVTPFPRSLRMSDASVGLAGLERLKDGGEMWWDKWLLDPGQVRPDVLSRPVPLGGLVFLTASPATETVVARTQQAVSSLAFLLDRRSELVAARAATLEGVQTVHWDEGADEGFGNLILEGPALGSAAVEVERFCREHRICVLDVGPSEAPAPRFDQAPEWNPLPARFALGLLVDQYLPGRGARLLTEDFGGQAGRLMLELARLVRGVPCYQLRVGNLADTVERVESVFRRA